MPAFRPVTPTRPPSAPCSSSSTARFLLPISTAWCPSRAISSPWCCRPTSGPTSRSCWRADPRFGRSSGLTSAYRLNVPSLTSPRLNRSFYARDPVSLARDLLGRVVFYRTPGGLLAGRIVEVEAYTGEEDPASHAFRGRSKRNGGMFGPAGFAYVYFTYGMHHCLNVTAQRRGQAGAVLIRALEPLAGIDVMRARGDSGPEARLLSGP